MLLKLRRKMVLIALTTMTSLMGININCDNDDDCDFFCDDGKAIVWQP